jgi:hypothetical protein
MGSKNKIELTPTSQKIWVSLHHDNRNYHAAYQQAADENENLHGCTTALVEKRIRPCSVNSSVAWSMKATKSHQMTKGTQPSPNK